MDDHRHHHRGGSELELDQGGLVFHDNDLHHSSYTCTYYVQSPSTLSHANSANIIPSSVVAVAASASADDSSAFQSPDRTETLINSHGGHLSSSSRGSNVAGGGGHVYLGLHAKKISYDARSHDTEDLLADKNRLIVVNSNGGDHHHHEDRDQMFMYDDDYDYYYGKRSRGSGSGSGSAWWWWWKMHFSYSDSDSSAWICLQIGWRFLVSFIVALLVFYLASRPPPPNLSIQVGRVLEFGLGEGVDRSGVATKILSCNCSLNLIIDNKSKLFGLHINPPTLEMSFHRLAFASTHGPKMYAESGSTTFPLSVGTRNKAMYGAGREMEDMLESGQGMPLTIRLSFSSTFRVVLNLIRPKFHHQAHCLLVLRRGYDKKHKTQLYNSTCIFT